MNNKVILNRIAILAACTWLLSCHLEEIATGASCASFSFNQDNTCTGACTVQFQNTSTDATNPRWDFGDGQSSTLPNPSHLYAISGTYTVTLTVDCPGGGESEFSLPVSIKPVTFEKSFDIEAVDVGYSVRQLANGGFVAVGNSLMPGEESLILEVKTTAHGAPALGYPRTRPGIDGLYSPQAVQIDVDQGYFIAGTRTKDGQTDGFFHKIAENGDVLDAPTIFGDPALDEGFSSMDQAADGSLILAGTVNTNGASGLDVYLVRPGPAAFFNKTIVGPLHESAGTVRVTPDGGYVIAGTSEQGSQSDIYLLKADAQGQPAPGFPRIYDKPFPQHARGVYPTADGGYVIVGGAADSDFGFPDIYLIKTDAVGNELFAKTYPAPGADAGYAVVETAEGGFALIGTMGALGLGGNDMCLIRTDAMGNALPGFPKFFGSAGEDTGYDLRQTADGGFILVGSIASGTTPGDSDLFLVKTDKDGNVQ
jgi:hypothetical protein